MGWLLALCALWLLHPSAWGQATDGATPSLRVERTDEGLFVSANLRFTLPAVVEEALEKGIPIFFVTEADVLRERWYWYDLRVASARRYTRVSYQPLTRRWRVQISNEPLNAQSLGTGLAQQYDSLEEVLSLLHRVARWKVADASSLEASERYVLRLRFRLDQAQLPRALQTGGAGPSDWKLELERRVDVPAEPAR